MKNLRQLCAATMLALILSISTFAGEMGTPGKDSVPPPPPPPPVSGEMGTPGRLTNNSANESANEMDWTLDMLREGALFLYQNVLSVF